MPLPEKHTPLPWFDDGYRIHGPTESADKRDGKVIFDYKQIDGNPADYPFIIKAVTCHDEAISALQYAKMALIFAGHKDIPEDSAVAKINAVLFSAGAL